jgi:diguanylate cyclase (GGDEF)-like protein
LSDPLNGLANRRAGEQALGLALARARETGGPASVLLLDLDRFKRLNDTHGHEAGDAVLRAAAEACAEVVRAGDTVARWGGEDSWPCCRAPRAPRRRWWRSGFATPSAGSACR